MATLVPFNWLQQGWQYSFIKFDHKDYDTQRRDTFTMLSFVNMAKQVKENKRRPTYFRQGRGWHDYQSTLPLLVINKVLQYLFLKTDDGDVDQYTVASQLASILLKLSCDYMMWWVREDVGINIMWFYIVTLPSSKQGVFGNGVDDQLMSGPITQLAPPLVASRHLIWLVEFGRW